jgi:hypothetical protein
MIDPDGFGFSHDLHQHAHEDMSARPAERETIYQPKR